MIRPRCFPSSPRRYKSCSRPSQSAWLSLGYAKKPAGDAFHRGPRRKPPASALVCAPLDAAHASSFRPRTGTLSRPGVGPDGRRVPPGPNRASVSILCALTVSPVSVATSRPTCLVLMPCRNALRINNPTTSARHWTAADRAAENSAPRARDPYPDGPEPGHKAPLI